MMFTIIALIVCCYLCYKVLKGGHHCTSNPSIPFVSEGYLPLLGHALSLRGDKSKFLLACKARYGSVFQLKIFHQTITFLLDPYDWLVVIRNPNIQTNFNEQSRRIFGFSDNALKHEDIISATYTYFRRYVQNPEGLRPLTLRFVECAVKAMMDDRAHSAQNQWKTSSLLALSRQFIFYPSFCTLFGDADLKSVRDIAADFQTYDAGLHHLTSPLPPVISQLFCRSTLNARKRLAKYFIEHPHLSNESKLIASYTDCLENHSDTYSKSDYGSSLTSLLFASIGNTVPAAFWSLYYILRDPAALKAITEELQLHLPQFDLQQDDQTSLRVDESICEALSRCVHLESAINETLRLMTFIFLPKQCSRETEVKLHDGRSLVLKTEDKILLYPALSHHNNEIFSDPEVYQFDRFLRKSADTSRGFMPFGAGKHMCPGRHFAKNEIKITVALILHHIEYEFLEPNVKAEPILVRMGLGVAVPQTDIPIRYRYKD